MSVSGNTAVLVSLAIALAPLRASALGDLDGWRPSPVEATLLPKFCWAQFMGNRFRGPEFSIPRDSCGPGMNHFCPGLVALNRANRSLDNRAKRGYLQGARAQVLYTVKAMEKYPRCPIRGQVQSTYTLIERELSSPR